MKSAIKPESQPRRIKTLPAVLIAAIIAFLLGTIAAFASKVFANAPRAHVAAVHPVSTR
jgi:hypothetical protein